MDWWLRVETSGLGKGAALKELFGELKASGRTELAELFMIFHSVMRENEMQQPVFNFHNATIANANFGTQIGTITASVTALRNSGAGQDFAEALKVLMEAVVNSEELDSTKKGEALESLEFIGQEAELPADKRKTGILRAVLDGFHKLVTSASALTTVWHLRGAAITAFFGF